MRERSTRTSVRRPRRAPASLLRLLRLRDARLLRGPAHREPQRLVLVRLDVREARDVVTVSQPDVRDVDGMLVCIAYLYTCICESVRV